jgi:nitroreductase
MNGKIITNEEVNHLLELADWAPTHGRTEPWRFVVYPHDKMRSFCNDHSELYKEHTVPEKFKETSYEKLKQASEGASHLIIAYMKRGNNPNIPEIEEIAAVSAAIQNFLLAATDHGYATFWSTSGMIHHDALKEYLTLKDEDLVLGLLFLGVSDEPQKEGKRVVPLSQKVTWI